ncbi:response regulator [Phenylobacterium sp.]|jgi:DNA-binding response OmpR family regulator|uniref:response regulator n=1 Tax=Phenylobacterium sp. TaxID=1871053 RepID=UPI002F9397CD
MAAAERPLEGLSVLVLEDDFYLAEDAREALEAAGAAVLGPCRDAAAAVDLAERRRPDFALLDINLGEGPQFGPARTFRDRGVPFLFMTGYDADVVPGDLQDVERLEKPVAAPRLVAAVARACRA